jgi:hypothetical protein
MYFNGLHLMLVFAALFIGFLIGVRYENQYQKSMRQSWIDGETIEQQMARDGWQV